MNPELRAQVEKLDVWRMTLAAREQRGASKQTEEEKRLAWQAYYECNLSKARSAKGTETGQKSAMYIPQCFKEMAAESGIQTDPPSPSKAESEKPQSSDEGMHETQQQSQQVQDLKRELVLKRQTLEEYDSIMQSAAAKESELNERIKQLEVELDQIRNDHLSLMTEKETLVARLTEGQEAMTDMEHTNASLIEQRTSLETEIEKLKGSTLEGISVSRSEVPPTVEDSEEIKRLRMMLEEATEESKKSKAAFEEERIEKEAILTKMKHAKQQFDKLREQSHNRNVENNELKAEIERMRREPVHSETSTSVIPEDIVEVQSTLQELRQEKMNFEKRCADFEEEANGLRRDMTRKDEIISQLTSQVETANESLEETKLKLDQIEAEKQSMARLLEQCQHELELKSNELDAAKTTEAEIEERLQLKMLEIEDLSEILDQKEQEMEALQSVQQEIALLQTEAVVKDARLEESLSLIHELQEKVSTLTTEMEKAEKESASQAEGLGEKEAEIVKLKEENDRLKDEISGHSVLIGNLEFEIVEMNQETEKLHQTSMEQAEALSKRETEILKLKQEFHEFMTQIDQLNEEIRQRDHIVDERTAQVHQLVSESEEREAQNQHFIREKEKEIDQLAEKLQESLFSKDNIESELKLCLTQMNEKDNSIAVLHEQAEREMLARDQQLQELLKERETLSTQLKAAQDTVTSSDTMKMQLVELDSLYSEAQTNLQTANGKIQELDVALSEALEIAEMADHASQQAVEQKEQIFIELRSMQEQLDRATEKNRVNEEAVIKTETLQMQLSRKDVEVESLKTRYQTSSAQLEDMTSQLATVRHEMTTTKGQLTETQHRLTEMTVIQEQLRVAEKAKESIQETLNTKQEELNTAREQTIDVQRQLDIVNEQRGAIERRLESSKEHQLYLQDRITELENEAQSVQRSITERPDLQDQLRSTETELNQLKGIREKQNEEIEKLRQQTESMPTLQQKIVRLETALAIAGQSQQPLAVKDTSEMQTLQQKISRAEAREADLYAEVKSLRLALEEARKQSLLPSSSEVSQLVGGLSNKKDEDRGYDVEAAVLSGGDPSGFQPLSGLLRGVPAMKYLSPCIRSADFVDRGFIFLMRHPALRYVLLIYFAVLHLVVFV